VTKNGNFHVTYYFGEVKLELLYDGSGKIITIVIGSGLGGCLKPTNQSPNQRQLERLAE
jgi:hypothetical protein